MLKKLTLTIVLILSILCLGGCNMEEQKEEVKEEVYTNNFSLYVENHLDVDIELHFINCGYLLNGKYEHKYTYFANSGRGFSVFYNNYDEIDITYNGKSYKYHIRDDVGLKTLDID